jgi:hypothetical protein
LDLDHVDAEPQPAPITGGEPLNSRSEEALERNQKPLRKPKNIRKLVKFPHHNESPHHNHLNFNHNLLLKMAEELYDGAVGIDLGTTYSCVATYEGNNVEIIANESGSYTTPSFVSFTDKERLIGESAKNQAAMNPRNTIFDIK